MLTPPLDCRIENTYIKTCTQVRGGCSRPTALATRAVQLQVGTETDAGDEVHALPIAVGETVNKAVLFY